MDMRKFTAIGPAYREVKDKLFDQYAKPDFDESTGIGRDELIAGFNAIAALDGEISRMEIRARLFEFVMENARIDVDPEDWFADHFDNGNQIMTAHREKWRREIGETGPLTEEAEILARGRRTGSFFAELDLGHISPGWRNLLKKGAAGILKEAEENMENAADDEARDFYGAVVRMYRAFITLMIRLEAQARKMAEVHPEAQDRMGKLAACLSALQERAPETLYEALELTYLFHQLIEFEGEWVRSMGSFEMNFGPFYYADIEAGRITEEDAKELISYFWMKFYAHTRGSGNGKNFYFGGLVDGETDNVGELSYLALELFYELNQTDPKLSIKINSRTPERFKRLIAKCLRDGRTNMVIVNDDLTIEALKGRGIEAGDAYEYLLIGCYEPAIEGKEVACNMCIKFNTVKAVELAMHGGIDPMSGERLGPETSVEFADFEEFYKAFEVQMEKQLRDVQRAINGYEENWHLINPSPFISATFPVCMEKGRDISRRGAKYNNTGSMGGGLANTADSLLAIKQLVFDEGRYSMEDLKAILKDNFAGHEYDRLYMMRRVPKWGNNDDAADEMAKRVAESYTGRVNGVPNGRGGRYNASMFTLDHCFTLGHRTGATPDGREEGHYIAKGVGAMTGNDRAGVTAHIQSVSKLDFLKIPNGSVLDLYLHPSAVDGQKGIDTLIQLMDTYFGNGGYGVQFNILNADELREAQKHPEEYSTLQVRVCGWNVYFVTLNEEQQNHFIETTMQVV